MNYFFQKKEKKERKRKKRFSYILKDKFKKRIKEKLQSRKTSTLKG